MTSVPFTKVESVGNDFVLVEKDQVGDLDLSWLAQQVCPRRFAIGSDGLLVIWREGSEIHLRFFNPDGSEDFCGNGLRCAAWYAYRQGWTGEQFEILQNGMTIGMEIEGDARITASMPAASFEPGRVPVQSDEEWWEKPVLGVVGTALTTGSTHFITFVDELPGDEDFLNLGPKLEHAEVFPERTSIMWVTAEAHDRLVMRIWERGVGETQGCGTGAMAAAVVWFRKTGRSGEIDVVSSGGTLRVAMDHWSAPITITSEPEELFRGTILVPVPGLEAAPV